MMHARLAHAATYLERRLHIDVRYYAKGGFWLVLGQFAVSGISLLSAIAFANLLTPQSLGEYRFLLSLIGLMALFTLPGMETGLMRAISRGFERTLVPLVSRKVLVGLLGSLGALAGAIYYALNDNYVLAGGLFVGALFIPIKDSFGVFDTLLTARKEWRTLSLYRPLAQGIPVLAVVGTLLVTNNIVLVLAALFATTTVTDLLLLFRTMRKHPLTGGEDPSALSYGYHVSFMRAYGGIAGQAYSIALFQFLGAAPLAAYYLSVAPTEQLRGLMGHIESLLFPRSARDNWKLGFGTFVRTMAPFVCGLGLLSLVYILLAPYLFALLFPKYPEAIFYSQLFMPSIILTGLSTVLMAIVRSKGLVHVQYITSIVDATLSFLLAIPLIYFFGVIGLIGAIYVMKLVGVFVMVIALFTSK